MGNRNWRDPPCLFPGNCIRLYIWMCIACWDINGLQIPNPQLEYPSMPKWLVREPFYTKTTPDLGCQPRPCTTPTVGPGWNRTSVGGRPSRRAHRAGFVSVLGSCTVTESRATRTGETTNWCTTCFCCCRCCCCCCCCCGLLICTCPQTRTLDFWT